jgi:hypothetical protein
MLKIRDVVAASIVKIRKKKKKKKKYLPFKEQLIS